MTTPSQKQPTWEKRFDDLLIQMSKDAPSDEESVKRIKNFINGEIQLVIGSKCSQGESNEKDN